MELKEIPINKIQPNPLQPRDMFDKEKIKELSDSIKEADLLQPIVVAPKDKIFEIVAGERRWRAFKMLKKTKIPAIIWDVKNDIDALEKGTIENWHRLRLEPTELENAVYSLWKSGKYGSNRELAKKLGKSETTIQNIIFAKEERVKHGISHDVPSFVFKEARGLPDEDRKKLIKSVETGKIRKETYAVREAVSMVKKAPESVKKAVLEKDLEPETAKRIMEIERPSVREQVLEKAVEGRITPTMVHEEARKIELQERKIDIKHPEEAYYNFTNALTNLEDAIEKLQKTDMSALSKNQKDGMGRSLYVFMATTLPKFMRFLIDNEIGVDPRFEEYLKKFR